MTWLLYPVAPVFDQRTSRERVNVVTRVTAPGRRGSSLMRQEAIDGYLCVLPWVLGFVLFTAGPMIASAVLAFTEYDISFAPNFNGLANFRQIIGGDPLFWKSLANTAFYTFIFVPLHLAIALTAALALNVRLRRIGIYRTIFYIPSITPTVASAFLWMWVFNPDYGLANVFLQFVGLPPSKWLFDEDMAKPSFIIMSLWGLGSAMIIFLADLQGVPEQLYEAAAIDGANAIRRFFHITIPMITPVIFFNLVVGIIGSFQIFTVAYVATQGGPNNATLFYVLYLYNQGFQFLHMGYASALAWVLFVIILAFTFLQLGLARRWVYYEGEARA
jgi:multiple sugar transport system permease protein